VQHLIDARRRAIRRVAQQHRITGLRWWPPSANPAWCDFVVDTAPGGLAAFRSELESVLGCRVAVHLAARIPAEAWGTVLVDTVVI
jgi:hypothetical protein